MKRCSADVATARPNPSQANITVLQVLVALVATRVPRGVSDQAQALGQQLLLGARQAAALGIAAAWRWEKKQKKTNQRCFKLCVGLKLFIISIFQIFFLFFFGGVATRPSNCGHFRVPRYWPRVRRRHANKERRASRVKFCYSLKKKKSDLTVRVRHGA